MIPGIGFAAAGTKALSFLKGLPKWVWVALAAIIVAGVIIWRTNVWFDNQIEAAEARGEARVYAAVEQRAVELKGKADQVAAKIRRHKNEEDQRVAVVVDDFRLRGPGKASCPSSAFSTSGGRQQAGAALNPTVGSVHPEARSELVALPFSVWADVVESLAEKRGRTSPAHS
jgi:nitrogen fixation/metabolism regulation signal transduction histidine kinase